MARWFALDVVGAEVFTDAPHVDVRVMELAASADEVWAALTGDTRSTGAGGCRRAST